MRLLRSATAGEFDRTIVDYFFVACIATHFSCAIYFTFVLNVRNANNSNIDTVEEEVEEEGFSPTADASLAEATHEESSFFYSFDSEDASTPTAGGGSNEDFPGDVSTLARNGAGGGRGSRGGSNLAGTATTTSTAPVDRSVVGGGTTAGTATSNTTSTSAPTHGKPDSQVHLTPTVGRSARPGAASAFAGDTSTGAAASTSTSSVTSSRTGDTGNNTNDVAELSAAAPANEGRSSIRSALRYVPLPFLYAPPDPEEVIRQENATLP